MDGGQGVNWEIADQIQAKRPLGTDEVISVVREDGGRSATVEMRLRGLVVHAVQYNVTPTEQNKIAGDVGKRRIERRRMRAKLKVIHAACSTLSARHCLQSQAHCCEGA